MSFFFDEDDSDDGKEKTANNSFLCPNCGGTESYQDESGNLFCGLCFSQSQTQQNEAEMDYEDFNAHIARGRRGQVLGVRYARKGRKKTRKPAEDFDTSKPFPSLEECLTGYTTVIQACLDAACTLLELSEEQKFSIKHSVRETWLNYLQTWQEGAEFYRQYHPEVRISMRDSFISAGKHRNIVSRFLTNQAVEKIKTEEMEDEGKDQSDSEPDDDNEAIVLTQESKNSTQATLSAMLRMYRRKSPQDAALRIYPNMQTIAALLLAALSKLGVSVHHITKWIANGEIPLLNAFKECLSPFQQSSLDLIKLTFRMARIPSNYAIEYKAKLLMVAARQEPNLLPPCAVPLLTTRMVKELHLGRQVLNIALALLGEPVRSEEVWLPMPLERLKGVERKKEQILAAIVVACKFCPGWELRKYVTYPMIPWHDDDVELISSLSSYMDFVETKIMAGRSNESKVTAPPSFLEDEAKSSEHADTISSLNHRTIVLAGEPNPNQPSKTRLQKHHDWKLKLKKRKATWADGIGLGKYTVYQNRHAPLKTTHPHYQALLEFMAHITDVKAATIHLFVIKLDNEIYRRHEANLLSSRITPPPKKRKSRNEKRPKLETSEDPRLQGEISLKSCATARSDDSVSASHKPLNLEESKGGPSDEFRMKDLPDEGDGSSSSESSATSSPSRRDSTPPDEDDTAEEINTSQPLF